MKFAEESFAGVWPEAQGLLDANNRETGLEDEQLDVDIEKYIAMESSGIARVFTYRDDGGDLVGYGLFIFLAHPHHRTQLGAYQDTFYVRPSHRGIGAVRFIQWLDERFRLAGCVSVVRQVTTHVDFSRTLRRMGYAPIETAYRRRLL